MARYLSGRSKRRPQSQLSDDRDRYLSVDQAEPNLGDPTLTDVEANIPPGSQYQIVSVIGSPGIRYWIPRGGGLIPGAITVFDENTIIPNNAGISSITQLIFKGAAIKAEGYLNNDGSPGIGATITVFAPGSQGQFIINNSNEFTGVSSFFYDVSNNRIGVGTNGPTQILDVNGNIRLRGTVYDWSNNPGDVGNLLVKNSDGGISWTNSTSVVTGAGGTIGQIQFHSNTGLVDGADLFYYDFVNDRVGIGSTQPKYLLDVSGISSFKGTTYIDNLNVTNLGTFNNLNVNGFSTFTQLIDANGGATIDNVRIGVGGDNEIDTSTGNLILDSNSGTVIVDDNLTVIGITSVGFITAKNAYVSGILTATNLEILNTNIKDLNVTGIATIANANITNLNVTGIATNRDLKVTNYLDVSGNANFQQQSTFNNLRVTGVSTLGNVKISGNTVGSSTGNLVLDSAAIVQSNDRVFVNETTESTSSTNGSLTTRGGIGIAKNANIGGNLTVEGNVNLSSSGGITTTGGDFYVGGDLYISDDLFFDSVNANSGTFATFLTTKDFNATGISSISSLNVVSLNVTGFSTFTQLIDANGGATIDNVRIGVGGDNEIDTSVGNLTLDSAGGTVTVDDNLIVSGIATFNGNVTLGNEATDNVTFTSRVNSNILPSGTRDLGSDTVRWNNVYANTFNGTFSGNADTATALETARTFQISGDVDSPSVSFNGTGNVTLVTTLDTTGVTSTTYGSSTSVPVIDVDTKGRITSASNVGIDFSTATVAQSDSVKTVQTSTDTEHFLTFVADNNAAADYESLYTDANIKWQPNTNTLIIPTATAGSTSAGALWLNGGTGALLFDSQGQKRISWNDGGGHLNIRSGSYYSGGEKYTVAGDGATKVFLTSDGSDGRFDVQVATAGVNANDPITYSAGVRLEVGSFRPTTANLDLGTSANKWNNVYSNTFVGAVTGNAETATALANSRTFSISGDVEAPAVLFNGTDNVTLVTTLDNTSVSVGDYGTTDGASYPRFTVDAKGRITSASNVGIDFSVATVAQANKVATQSISNNSDYYLTFVDGNNVALEYESVYTNSNIFYNPSSNLFSVENLAVSGTATFNGNVRLGNAASDNVTFNSGVDSNILPSGTRDLGSVASKWNNVYAITFNGAFVGNADTATALETARDFSIAGDLTASAVSFNGTGNVELSATLNTTGVSADTYGSSTSVPIITVDTKGRITAASSVAISGSPIGSVINFAGNTAPTNHLPCNGAEISRTVYSELFAIIGTAYGVGDGVNTFNLPDLRNKFTVGSGDLYVPGNSGGSNSVTLSTNNLPAHSHGVTDPTHAHTPNGLVNFGGQNGIPGSTSISFQNTTGQISLTSRTTFNSTGITINNNTTTGSAVENRPPYLALLPCIKYQ